MITRLLTIRFQDGYAPCLLLPASDSDNELESAREFVGLIIKYKNAFQRLMMRSPKLSMGRKIKLYTKLDNVFHTIVNARKYLDIRHIGGDLFSHTSQHFSIDLITGTFTLYKNETKEERGTMPLDLIYSNWEYMFYNDLVVHPTADSVIDTGATVDGEPYTGRIEYHGYSGIRSMIDDTITTFLMEHADSSESEEATPEVSPEVSKEHPNTELMREKLDDDCFAFWNYCVNTRGFTDTISIHYSGSGDSGGVDDIEFIHDLDSDHEFHNEVWALINQRESGFYNNDGGYGNIVVSGSNFEWNHSNYYTSEDCTVSESVKLKDSSEDIEKDEDVEDKDYSYDEDTPLPF